MTSISDIPQDLLAAFWRYERALMTNNVEELDALFAAGSDTIRSDSGVTLAGYSHISAFRAGRPQPPQRWLEQVFVTMLSDTVASVVAQSRRAGSSVGLGALGGRGAGSAGSTGGPTGASAFGGRGAQTQVWVKGENGWQVRTAHVSLAASEAVLKVEPDDPTIWRVAPGSAEFPTLADRASSTDKLSNDVPTNDVPAEKMSANAAPANEPPMVDGSAHRSITSGPLSGLNFAVKDLFAVSGHRIGGGNPSWLAASQVSESSAPAVDALLSAGAEIAGIAHTDELAFSLAGTNIHYGTPPNAAAPGHITGGSTSGPAAAVAAGLVDFGLGTDTAGSIRVPASHCGLYGLRTSHGTVLREGLVGLADSFDTVGIVAREAWVLRAANEALFADALAVDSIPEAAEVRDIIVVDTLLDLLSPDVREGFEAGVLALSLRMSIPVRTLAAPDSFAPEELESWFTAFRTVQSAEAWREHGDFVELPDTHLEPAVTQRFRNGQNVTAEQEADGRAILKEATARLTQLLPPGTVLALPSAAGGAPRVDASPQDLETSRAATLKLTGLASLAGLPALGAPLLKDGTLPLGLCLVAAPHHDRTLLRLVTDPRFAPSSQKQAQENA